MNRKHLALISIIGCALAGNAIGSETGHTVSTLASQPHDIAVVQTIKPTSETPKDAVASTPAAAESSGILNMRLIDVYHQVLAFFFQEERMLTSDIDRLKSDILQDTTELEQLVGAAGYKLSKINVGISLFPKIDLTFDVERVLQAEEKTAVRATLASRKDSALVRWIMKTLLDAADLPLQSYDLAAVDMSVAIIPDVTLKLRPIPSTSTVPAH